MPKGEKKAGGRPRKPPRSYSDKFRNSLWASLNKKAKTEGKTVFDLFADLIYTRVGKGYDHLQDAVWVSLWKSLTEVMAAKETHQTIEDKRTGPQIGFPALREPTEDAPTVATKKWKN